MTISPMTSSATLRVLENGALNTGIPASARGVEIHLVGADAEAADRDQPVRGLEHVRGELRARADASRWTPLQRFLQRIRSPPRGRLGQASG